jgi:tetratricopeptide (TPR) repeat protein
MLAAALLWIGGQAGSQAEPSAPARLYQARAGGDAAGAAQAYRLLGDPVSALAYGYRQPDPSAALLRAMAEWALAAQHHEAAADLLGRLIAQDPRDGWAHLRLGLLLAASEKAEALAHLQTAWTLGQAPPLPVMAALTDNTNPRTLAFEVGTALSEAGEYALAERAFEQAVTRSPFPAEAMASVGLARALQGLVYEPWAEAAVRAAPTSSTVYVLNGLAYRAGGRAFESLGALLGALNLAPLDPEINAQVAQAYALLGDEQSAAYWHGQAAAISGQDARYVKPYRTAQAVLAAQQPQDP